jgi:hypothetical protein
LTTQEDVGKFVISAIRDKNRVGHVKISGNEMSTKEIIETYNKVLNRKESGKFMGSVEDLKKRVMELKEQGKLFDSINLGYTVFMYEGSGKIKEKMNSQFSDVKVTTLEDFLGVTQGKISYDYTIPNLVKSMEKQILQSTK